MTLLEVPVTSLISNKIQDITQTSDGNMWFATDGGLSQKNPIGWLNYSRQAIGTYWIYEIEPAGEKVWLASSIGLLQSGPIFSEYNHKNAKALLKDNEGNLWIGSINGLTWPSHNQTRN